MAKAADSEDKNVRNKSKKGHKKLIAFMAVLIIIGIVAVLYEMYGSVPAGLIFAVSSGKPLTAATLSGVLLQKIASSQTFSANYTGTVAINSQDPVIIFSFNKYINNTLFYDVNFESIFNSSIYNQVAVAGIGEVGYNGSLPTFIPSKVCLNVIHDSAVLNSVGNGGISTIISLPGYTPSQYLCAAPSSQFSNNIENLFVNMSSLGDLKLSSYSLRFLNGNPCYFVSGTGTIDVNSTILGYSGSKEESSSLNFSSCISAKYDIPFNLTMNINGNKGGSMDLKMNVRDINQHFGLGNFTGASATN